MFYLVSFLLVFIFSLYFFTQNPPLSLYLFCPLSLHLVPFVVIRPLVVDDFNSSVATDFFNWSNAVALIWLTRVPNLISLQFGQQPADFFSILLRIVALFYTLTLPCIFFITSLLLACIFFSHLRGSPCRILRNRQSFLKSYR